VGRDGEANHCISSCRNSIPPGSAAGSHCDSHPMCHRQHTWYSSCMCCSPAGRGCLVVPLCLLSFEGAPLRFCQRAAQVPSFVRSMSMGSVDIFLSILYQQQCGSPSRVVERDAPQPCAVVEVCLLSLQATSPPYRRSKQSLSGPFIRQRLFPSKRKFGCALM
jgi:hypothetical protein